MCLSNLRVRVSAEVRKMVDDTFTSLAGGSGHPSLVNQALVDASKEQPLKGLRMVNVTVKMKPDSHDCTHAPTEKCKLDPSSTCSVTFVMQSG